MTALGGLIGIAVGSVLLISASASFKNTLELTEKRSELTVAAIERGVGDNLAPAQNLIRDIAHRCPFAFNRKLPPLTVSAR